MLPGNIRKPVRLFLLFLVASCQAVFTTAQAADVKTAVEISAPYAEVNRYTITRKGKRIGTHELRFNRSGDSLEVSIDSSISVSVLKIPVFRMDYTASERWDKSQLLSATATTVMNKKTGKVTLSSDGTANSTITKDGKTQTVPAILFATNHWNPQVLGTTRVFNTIKGEASNVVIKKVGNSEVKIGDQMVPATQYQYTGDIKANVWYDYNWRWIKLNFAGDDGSVVNYTLEK